MGTEKKTKNIYSFLWESYKNISPYDKWHFNEMQSNIPHIIVQGALGIDIGSGCGFDTYIMAKNNPSVKIISLDISDGIYKTKELTSKLKNVWCIKGSALRIPIKDNMFNFAYSFGVLHHISQPEMALREIARIIKPKAFIFLYLYEDHSDNPLKHFSLKIITILRKITTKIPHRFLYVISYLFSPFIFILFSYPSRILKKINRTKSLAKRIPFNFAVHPFSLAGDIYDRFTAPLEHRFNKEEAYVLLNKNGFDNIYVKKIESKAGWVVWGSKPNA